ncbi:ACS family tartrate transporter-like MFS transporter [Rhodococcus wratislaviensis]|uniref:MFS transporter n=1 Tax=Rhodococcus wratislaviensis TaxID=44752 RepID=A0AB38FQV1_RHOWR|nr:MFS transporter [Rhodococcus wratislaviensis]REE75911.1 ACS family tartrate transporter-like MFS transporter [Rhodococcus wratislaviensis]SPZ43615.1 MFS transporter [Rhodococcus wratislaviensis]
MGVSRSAVPDSEIGARTLKKVSYRILPFVMLLYIFNYMDRTNISYAQLGMQHELGITVGTFGAVASIFFLAYVVFEIPSNMALKKFGARIWLARIAITWGIVTVIMGFVNSVTQLYVARVALGIAEAGLFPGLLLYLTFWFRSGERARAIAMMAMAQPIAMIIGSFTGGLILDHISWFDMSGWRWVFILQGAPTIVLGLIVLVYLPNRPREAKFLTTQESEWLEDEITAEYQEPETHAGVKEQLGAIKNRKILHLAFANLFAACGLYGFTFFLPQIVKQMDPSYSATNIGFLGAVPFVVGAVGMLLISRYSDRTGERKLFVIGLMVLAAVGLFGTIVFRHSPVLALTSLSMVAVGVLGYMAPYWAMAAQVLTRAETAVGLAAINTIAAMGGFFGPYVIGKNATADNVTIGLYFPIACLLICAVMLAFLKIPKKAPVELEEATTSTSS